MSKQQLVVVGNGMAGARTVEEILKRRGGEQFDITILGEEPHGNYNRILLSSVLNGSQDARDIFLHSLDWYRDNGVTLHHGAPATKIDRANKRVLTNENDVPYDKLILATGSRPFVPPMNGLTLEDGEPKPGVFVFRTLDDCRKIAGYATKSRRAVVIGGGLLGLEAARGLVNYGCDVHVVHLSTRLMEMQLDEIAGAMLKTAMEETGLRIHLEKSTTNVLGDDMVIGVRFKDGATLPCDMVVISCGVKPNVELAKDAGLNVERAIVVDDAMRTSDSDIFAVGECVQHRGRVYGLVAPLWEQGRVLADVITGSHPGATYRGSKLATKLKVLGCDVATMGVTQPEDGDEVVQWVEEKRGRYKKLIIRDGKLAGAILLGDAGKAGTLIQAFERGTPLPQEREHLLFDIGTTAPAASLSDMPDDARVCNCNAVSKGAILSCVSSGKRTLGQVMSATRAGTGCGSCKSLVSEIIEWTAQSVCA